MGGRGSGYHSWRRVPRNLVEHAFALDVSALGELGALAGTVGYGHITLVARASGVGLLVSYTASLADPANPHLELTFVVDGEWREQVIDVVGLRIGPREGSGENPEVIRTLANGFADILS